MKNLIALAAGTLVILTAPAFSQSHTMQQHGSAHKMQTATIAVEQPWARASIGKNGAAYARLTNKGTKPDRLVDVKSSIAARVEIHTHIKDGDIMRMRQVEGGIPVAPGESVTMKPGGYHVMLIGLKKKLETGSSFSLTFVFENGGEVKTMAEVGKVGSMGPAGMPSMPGGQHGSHKH